MLAPVGYPKRVARLTTLPNHCCRHPNCSQGHGSARESAHIIVETTRSLSPSQTTVEIVTETGDSEKLVRDIVRKIDLSEYKRKQTAPCLRVTTNAFGIDRRVHIAERSVEWDQRDASPDQITEPADRLYIPLRGPTNGEKQRLSNLSSGGTTLAAQCRFMYSQDTQNLKQRPAR